MSYAATSSINFGVLVYVIGFIDPFANDPNSSTILLPSSNSNQNPFVDSTLLGGTSSFVGLNSSEASFFATFYICSLVSYRPSYVCYCCYYKCCGFVVVSIYFFTFWKPCVMFPSHFLALLLQLSFLWRCHL